MTDFVSFDDYRDGLLQRAWDLRCDRHGDDWAAYREALEAVCYARGRWALLVLADHEVVAARIVEDRRAQYEDFLDRLVTWADTGTWL